MYSIDVMQLVYYKLGLVPTAEYHVVRLQYLLLCLLEVFVHWFCQVWYCLDVTKDWLLCLKLIRIVAQMIWLLLISDSFLKQKIDHLPLQVKVPDLENVMEDIVSIVILALLPLVKLVLPHGITQIVLVRSFLVTFRVRVLYQELQQIVRPANGTGLNA